MTKRNGRRHDRDYSFLGTVKETSHHVEEITTIVLKIVVNIATIIAIIAGVLTGSSALHQAAEFLG